MSTSKKIIAFHLLNDRSGSPKVLSQILNYLVLEGYHVNLYTSSHTDGFLSNLKGVYYYKGWYRFKSNPWMRLVYYLVSQVLLILRMYSKVKKEDIIYVNTVLPFGAALLGKLKGCRVIYHIHESTIHPPILQSFLYRMVSFTATEIINVSNYVQQSHGLLHLPNHRVYNAISEEFMEKKWMKQGVSQPNNALMICSLKKYKGVLEFVQLSEDFPSCDFKLVLNAKQEEIDAFFQEISLPKNLQIYSTQKDLHPFLQWADIMLNLSRPDGWIETFGLTILEGMAYGLPAIVPPVGGIVEVIEEGVTGFAVDSRDRELLNHRFQQLRTDTALYQSFSEAAHKRIARFREQGMLAQVSEIFEQEVIRNTVNVNPTPIHDPRIVMKIL